MFRSELRAREHGTIAKAADPTRLYRARHAPTSPRHRARIARAVRKVSARPASSPVPDYRVEKNQGKKMAPERFSRVAGARVRRRAAFFLPESPLNGIVTAFSRVRAVRVSFARHLARHSAPARNRPSPGSHTGRGTFR